MSKSREEKEAQAREQQAQEQRRQAELQRTAAREAERRITEAGRVSREQMLQAGKPRPEETARLERYRGKALTPAETLMTQAGPISQAVARRIQERVETPGMDFPSEAYAEQIGAPLWRGLKARGIAPRPGAEGGLGVSQYMKSAAPAMAILRSQQIGQDITRGQEYGREARGEVGRYEDLERILGDIIAERLFKAGIKGAGVQQRGVETGAPWGPAGAQAYAGGMIGARETESAYAAQRAEQQRQKRQQEAEMIGDIISLLTTGGVTAPTIGAKQIAQRTFQPDRPTGGYFQAPSLRIQEQTPYSRALQARVGGR